MSLKNTILLFVCSLFLVNTYVVAGSKTKKEKQGWDSYISLVNLIATPEKYHTKNICTVGIFDFVDDFGMLFVNKFDYENVLSNNAKGVFYRNNNQAKKMKKLNGELVTVCGTYDNTKLMANGTLRGAIQDVTVFERWYVRRDSKGQVYYKKQ